LPYSVKNICGMTRRIRRQPFKNWGKLRV